MDYEKGDLPFFPVADLRDENGCGIMEGSPGISLRDWFAGQVLASAAALPFGQGDYLHRAKVAYEQADAMLAARVPSAPAEQPMQHVAYFDEGQFHWMSGRAPRDCELYARAKS